ncbi:MAG: ATP-binding cassette domain-containing protein [Clostridia bacterium]
MEINEQTRNSAECTILKQVVNGSLQALEADSKEAVRIHRLTKRFGTEEVLKHISLDLPRRQIHGIIGRNGSGKTVMLKCVCGFLKPDLGIVNVLGKIVGKDCDFPPNTGVLIETPGFLNNESARSNLKWLAQIHGGASVTRVDDVISIVGLDPSSKKHVGKYSLGMRQRLGIAQALLDDPELLILDEPMNALDKQGVSDMRRLLLALKAQGKTIVLASHFAQDIDVLCDTVHEMDQGQLTRIQ